MGSLMQDARFAARSFARKPSFVFTVVALVALGVGATTTIFSVVDGVLLTDLPYPRPDELVFFGHPSHSGPLLEDWRDRTHSFATVVGGRNSPFDMAGDGPPESVPGANITEGFFDVFGARASRGRLLRADDFVGESPRVAVVGHGFWQRSRGGDPAVVGQTVVLNGEPAEIVGVLSPDFVSPEAMVGRRIDVWLPVDLEADAWNARDTYRLRVVARLRPGTGLEAARADVERLSRELAVEFPEQYTHRDGSAVIHQLVPLHEETTGTTCTCRTRSSGACFARSTSPSPRRWNRETWPTD